MALKEKDFQRAWNRWARSNIDETITVELKFTRANSLPFARLVEHQKRSLLEAKHGTLVYKIPDLGMQNPFDAMVFSGTPAYVVIMFYERGTRHFYMIDIDDWNELEEEADRKSITEEMAAKVGDKYELSTPVSG